MANLITLSTYKDITKIKSAESDFILQSYIDSISQLVKTYCNNSFLDFYSSNKVETFSINWAQQFVQLAETPVNTIVSVKERTGITENYSTLSSSNEYYFDPITDAIYRSNGNIGYKNFPQGPGAVEVTYTAGYASTPEDLKLAVIDLVTYYFKEERKNRQTIAGASIQNLSLIHI